MNNNANSDKKRMKIALEFKVKKAGESELYDKLISFSNPQGIIKDILMGKLPLSILNPNEKRIDKIEEYTIKSK